MLDSLSQSFVTDGEKAFSAQKSIQDNPHPEDTAPYYLWKRGFENRKKEADRVMSICMALTRSGFLGGK